ncbi:hypothetical protein BD770DRAFT_448517 [Pilaira anomala]|nr:hypothetical protein BD770DRAFT_448517 [Pilaira anomala]
MGGWNDVPSTILEHILDQVESDYQYTGNPRWKSVSKSWFNLYLRKRFKVITIKISKKDPTLKSILKSPFHPGQWVERINIMKYHPFESVDVVTDPLSQLMSKCPNVKKVYVDSSKPIHWNYFYHVLLLNDSWKGLWALGRLIDPNMKDPKDSANYRNSLFHLSESIRHLALSSGLLEKKDWARLKEFRLLEAVEIEENVVSDLYECCSSLLPHMPLVHSLSVAFSPYRATVTVPPPPRPETIEDVIINLQSPVKRLCLENFSPSNDQELLFLMQQFPQLNELHLYGHPDLLWNVKNSLSTPVLNLFFDYIHMIPSSNLNFVVDDCIWFLEQYYEWHDKLNGLVEEEKDFVSKSVICEDKGPDPDYILRMMERPPRRRRKRRQTPFMMFFFPKPSKNKSRRHNNQKPKGPFPIYLTIEDNRTKIHLLFKTRLSEMQCRNYILTRRSMFVKTLDIDIKSPNAPDDISPMVRTVLDNQPQLKALSFKFGVLENCNIPKSPHRIRNLRFFKVKLAAVAIRDMLANFPYLERLTFDWCLFQPDENGKNHFTLRFTDTVLGKLHIAYVRRVSVATWVLFKIQQSDLLDEEIYLFHSFDGKPRLKQIDYLDTLGENNLWDNPKVAIFKIECKSIKSLSFRRIKSSTLEIDQTRFVF